MQLLIDGDIILYRCGFAAENRGYVITGHEDAGWFSTKAAVTEWLDANLGEGVTREVTPVSEAEPVENALHNVKDVIASIQAALASDDVVIYLSGDTNFRDEIATERPYKGNRVDAPKPVHYHEIQKYLMKHYEYVMSDGQEADDELGIAQTRLTAGDNWEASCIISIDKDLDMIPGNHYNWVKEEKYFIDPNEAMLCFYTQLVTGDVTDNVPGIPKKGIKAARKALEGKNTPDEMYGAVRDLYVQAFTEKFADEALLEQARLLWIRRNLDELWEPPHV